MIRRFQTPTKRPLSFRTFSTICWRGGFLAITFIPILTERLAAGDESAQDHAFNAVFRPIAVIIVALTIAGMLSMGWLIDVAFGSRLDASQLVEVTRLTRIILPAQIFFILGGLFTAVQYVQGRFVIPTLAPIVYNLGIIIGGLVGSIGTREPTATGFMFGHLPEHSQATSRSSGGGRTGWGYG